MLTWLIFANPVTYTIIKGQSDNQPKAVKSPLKAKVDEYYNLYTFTFCLLVHNFFPDCPTEVILRLNDSWCYGDSHDIL